jgi:acetyltransferase-like isoleucine patch superfamily enzyme
VTYSFKFFIRAVVGNLATTLWFFPFLCKLVHDLRGVSFLDRSSVFISRNVVIDNRYPFLVSIGRDVWLTQGVIILAHSSFSNYQKCKFNANEIVLPVCINDGVFIGVASVICPGVTIGEGAYIGAGSVVTKNVDANVMVAGNPAKLIRYL